MADSQVGASTSGRHYSDSSQSLQQDVLKLLNNSRLSNVSFLCEDDVVIYADKFFLAVRSDYFDKLLFGGLKEASQQQIHLTTVLSTHLLPIFEFFHSGRLSLAEDSRSDLVLGIYELARQYNIPELQDHLLDALPGLLKDGNVGEFLTAALQLHAPAIESQALQHCSSMSPHKDMFLHFSQDALTRTLVGSSLTSQLDNRSASCFLEAVVQWGRAQVGNFCLEGGSPASEGSHGDSTPSERLAQVLLPVCELIDFESPPILDLMHEENELLSLLPVERQLQVFKAQSKRAVKKARVDFAVECPWDPRHHGSGLAVINSLTGWDVLACDSEEHVSARGTHCFESGVYEWEVMVEVCCNHMWVGLAGEGADLGSWLGVQKAGWVIGGGGDKCHAAPRILSKVPLPGNSITYQGEKYRSLPYCQNSRVLNWGSTVGTRVVMRVDMGQRECSFKIDGVDCGVAFSGLPCPVYPAVSLIAPGKVCFIGYRHFQQG